MRSYVRQALKIARLTDDQALFIMGLVVLPIACVLVILGFLVKFLRITPSVLIRGAHRLSDWLNQEDTDFSSEEDPDEIKKQ